MSGGGGGYDLENFGIFDRWSLTRDGVQMKESAGEI